MEIYKSLDNKGSLTDKDAKVTILYSQSGMLLYTMGRYYKSHFRGSDISCKIHCSIFDECAGYENSLCRKIYYLMNKRTGPRLYFAEIKMTLFLSRIFISKLR